MAEADPQFRPRTFLAGVPVAALAYLVAGWLPFGDVGVEPGPARMALAVTVLTAWAWLLRAMPLAPASLLPLALMPLLGARPMADVAAAYAHPIIWLFFGGFVLALAISRWGLHRRLALNVIQGIGMRPRRLVLGFMLAGFILSMWISNTATSLMLLPIGVALVDRVIDRNVLPRPEADRFGVALMLGIAYGCSVGGVASPLGTAPNLLFLGAYSGLERAGAPAMSFFTWCAAFLPFAGALVLVIWILLTRVLLRLPKAAGDVGTAVREELASLGPVRSAERRVIGLFALAVLLWVTRGDVDFGSWSIPGWASLLGFTKGSVTDGTVAVGVAILAFMIPSEGRGSAPIMDWETAVRLRWDILFLLGGGVAIAGAFEHTGLCDALGSVAAPWLAGMSPWLMVAGIALFVTFLTEVTSNTAITALMLPLLLATSVEAEIDPRITMLPATIAASCAFMFPIATPPNAVVFSSGRVTFAQMAKTGLLLNFVAVVLLTVFLCLWVFPLLGVEFGSLPEWAR